MKKVIKKFFNSILYDLKLKADKSYKLISSLYEQINIENYQKNIILHKNTFVRYGKKTFSQSDEDGLIEEIILRINPKNRFFFEMGVGDGTECNTINLLTKEWKGVWVDSNKINLNTKNSKLKIINDKITKENILNLYKKALEFSNNIDFSLISIDLDGIDYHIVETILENDISPDLFIVEYNAKFAYDTEFIIDYDANHNWDHSDYFGASLLSYYKLFKEKSYKLIVCNFATGCNAFFVKEIYADLFPEVPNDIKDIYVPAKYWINNKSGHNTSLKTIKKLI
jgi:hypothetical protein